MPFSLQFKYVNAAVSALSYSHCGISAFWQFMLSGADKNNKGAYLTGLISRVCDYVTPIHEFNILIGF